MSVRLSCTTPGSRVEILARLLDAAGAYALAFEEAAEGPAFYDEGLAAEPRYWPTTRVAGLFASEAAARFAAEVVAGEAFAINEGLWIYPNGEEVPPRRLAVYLDPGLAFGTGTHPTTRLCLQWLSEALQDGNGSDWDILDFGCGSGILAIAALRMGAKAATGVDIDPLALDATGDNARRNGVSDRLRTAPALDADDGPYDLVVANVLAGPLIAQAAALSRAARGALALSGILPEQAEAVAHAFPGFALTAREDEGWILLHGRRRP